MFSHSNVNADQQEKAKEELGDDDWLIRRCELYNEEYKDCRAFASRFHQYFVYGKTIDCGQWKKDYDNCCKWTSKADVAAAKVLIASEKNRRLERLRPHYTNDVWEKRTSPPEDWNKPLPEYMQKEYEATYLNLKAKEMRGEIEPTEESRFCSIM